MWAHRETNGLPRELETLPAVLQCKTKGLPAAQSIYTPNELTVASDSGDFSSNTRLSRMGQVSKRSTFLMKFSLMANKCHSLCGSWLASLPRWAGSLSPGHSTSVTTTAPSTACTCREYSENSPKCNG